VKERRLRGDNFGHARSRREDFDPIAEGQRHGLAPAVSAAVWDRVRREVTNGEGLCDEDLARERFAEVAKRIAARREQLGPRIGKWTQVDAASSADAVGDVLTTPAAHKTTLVPADHGHARLGAELGPSRATRRELEQVSPEESLGFLRGALGAGRLQMTKLAQAVAAIDHGAALVAGNTLRQELRSARWHLANGLAHDERLQREHAAIEREAEGLLAQAPTVSDAALNAARVRNRSWALWNREAADWRATAIGAGRGNAAWFMLKEQALAHVAQIRRQPEPGAETERAQAVAPSATEIAAADDWLVGDIDGGGATAAAALAPPPGGMGPVLTRAINEGSGEPLPAGLKLELEAAAGADLSHVRVHHDNAAAQAAAAVAARAFAVGKDIYFAANAYDPASLEGQRLIAHEVAHTLQPEGPMGAGVTTPNDPVEREANAFVDKLATGENAGQPILFAATRTRLPRYPSVVPGALAEDKIRWIDDADHSLGKVWQEDRGYIKNPTAARLSETVKNGKIAGEFSNGSFMYVVDESGEIWVGKRLQKNMPHPTLIGGKDPKVLSAGMVEIQGGKIVKIDNHSGHFQGPRGSLRSAVKSFMKLPKQVFKKFSAESVHFDAEGKETRQLFNSLRMLKLKNFSPTKSINRLRMRWKNDPKFREKIKGGLKNVGKAGLAILATLILDYFLSKWMASIEQSLIRQDLERLAPQVEAELRESLEDQADKLDMLNETNPDATVYFNIVYRLSWMTVYSQGADGVDSNEGYAGATLVSAVISEAPTPEEFKFESIDGCAGSSTTNKRMSMSEAVKVSDLYGDGDDLQVDDGSTPQQKQAP
jgi:hypothetical protein